MFFTFVYQMWMLLLLTILDSCDDYAKAIEHSYTNTWAIQISADVNEAMRIAEKYGFTYKLKVSATVLVVWFY